MALKFGDLDLITSTLTRHHAMNDGQAWHVSWLPSKDLTRGQAITAMMIAEAVKSHTDELADSDHEIWGHVEHWSAELGLSAPHAVTEACLDPEDHGSMPIVVKDAETVANVKFIVTTTELGRAGTHVTISAHDLLRPHPGSARALNGPFAVAGTTVRVPGGRERGDAMTYFAELVSALNLQLNPPRRPELEPTGVDGRIELRDVASGFTRECACPVSPVTGFIEHQRATCTDPIIKNLDAYADPDPHAGMSALPFGE